MLAEHSAVGSANTQQGVQKGAPLALRSDRGDEAPRGAHADRHRR